VLALPSGDGLQPPRQGLHEVDQVLPPLKSCSKRDFADKFAAFLGLTILHLFTKSYQNCFGGCRVSICFAKNLAKKILDP
jgi:hypothetical protein